jgi:hypothetical protein
MSQDLKEVTEEVTAPVQEQAAPVFEEVNKVDEEGAISILIQAATLAQKTGGLSVRDSVLLAKAIDVVRPGSI